MENNDRKASFISRRKFINQSGKAAIWLAFPLPSGFKKIIPMKTIKQYDVVIIGGSYAGLAAAMALGRALRKVLVIDGGLPCNRQTPYSHNFITQDGVPPMKISEIARQQVARYDTVSFLNDFATKALKTSNGFEIHTKNDQFIAAKKLVIATGIKDQLPAIPGFAESWGISVLHCPYCHGYEVKGTVTGILANGESAFELAKLISNWTNQLTVFTNGTSTLTDEQLDQLSRHGIKTEERFIRKIEHGEGKVEHIVLEDNSRVFVEAIYARLPFTQHSDLFAQLGCNTTEEGYLKVDTFQKTSVNGVYACGDNSSRMRTVANAVATGTTAGMMLNKELIEDTF